MIKQFKYLPWLNLQSLTEKSMAGLGRTPNFPPSDAEQKSTLWAGAINQRPLGRVVQSNRLTEVSICLRVFCRV